MSDRKKERGTAPKNAKRAQRNLFADFDFCVLCAADPDACFVCKKRSQFTVRGKY
jgi:hypothetical protein